MREHGGAQVGDDALADDGDKIEAQRARDREHGGDRDHHGEILVDQSDPFGRKAEVDHAAHRERNRERRSAATSSATSAATTCPR